MLLNIPLTAMGLNLVIRQPPVIVPNYQADRYFRHDQTAMGLINENSLAGKMFATITESLNGLNGLAKMPGTDSKEEADQNIRTTPSGSNAISDLDARAQSGDINFEDFLTMSRAFAQLDADSAGVEGALPARLAPSELAETREKFIKHEKIVEVMLDEERLQVCLAPLWHSAEMCSVAREYRYKSV